MHIRILCVYNSLAGIKVVVFTTSTFLNVSLASCTSKIRSKILVFGWEKEISGHCDCGDFCIHLAFKLFALTLTHKENVPSQGVVWKMARH